MVLFCWAIARVATRLGASVFDLKELEFAYAPPYSSAKDPVNMLGFVAENVLNGLVKISPWNIAETNKDVVLLRLRKEGLDLDLKEFRFSFFE